MKKMINFFVFLALLSYARADMEAIIDENENKNLMGYMEEGDIIEVQGGAIGSSFNKYWPNGVVPYAYDSGASFSSGEKQLIRNSLKRLSDVAPCLTFREYTSNPPHAHVKLIRWRGCSSYIGRTGGGQTLSLSPGCMRDYIIQHEFLHALGFFHEQSRPDRDNFVEILWGNIISGREHNFRKSSQIHDTSIPYDARSVMHYSGKAFSKNGQPTIRWKADHSKVLGSSSLTQYDIDELNHIYCGGSPSAKLAKSLNGKIIALRSHHGLYVVAENSGHANANRGRVGPWEKFRVEHVSGSKIGLKSVAHNKYLVAESNGLANANRVHRGSWEIFTLEKVSDYKIALKSVHGRYLVAESNGHLNANRVHRGPWEVFDFDFPVENEQLASSLNNRVIGLLSVHGRYVVAEHGHANANRQHLGPWEKFQVKYLGGSLIALRSTAWNRYLVSESNGQCNCNRVHIGPWERFALKKIGSKIALESHFNRFVVAESSGHLNANRIHLGPWEMFTIVYV